MFVSLLASPVAFALGAALTVALLARAGIMGVVARRPAVVLGLGVAFGVAFRWSGLPGAQPDALREAARLALAFLAFAGAQQCRLSRIGRISIPALRLSLLAAPAFVLVSAVAVFALLPDLGLWSALLIAVALPLGIGAFDERLALAAPLSAETKRTVRLDTAVAIATGVPLAVVIEAVSIAPGAGARIVDLPGFALFAGAAVGGTIGLLLGRFLPVRDAPLPEAPIVAFAAAYGTALLLGFDPVMAGALCGFLYAEEAPLAGPIRTRIFSAASRWCAPPAFFALGALMGPVALQADLLVWLAALVPVFAMRVVARGAALGGTDLPAAEKTFLSWFGGAPGAGAALFVISLLASPTAAAQPGVLVVISLATAASLIVARLGSRPLVTRQVRAAARARRKRYGSA